MAVSLPMATATEAATLVAVMVALEVAAIVRLSLLDDALPLSMYALTSLLIVLVARAIPKARDTDVPVDNDAATEAATATEVISEVSVAVKEIAPSPATTAPPVMDASMVLLISLSELVPTPARAIAVEPLLPDIPAATVTASMVLVEVADIVTPAVVEVTVVPTPSMLALMLLSMLLTAMDAPTPTAPLVFEPRAIAMDKAPAYALMVELSVAVTLIAPVLLTLEPFWMVASMVFWTVLLEPVPAPANAPLNPLVVLVPDTAPAKLNDQMLAVDSALTLTVPVENILELSTYALIELLTSLTDADAPTEIAPELDCPPANAKLAPPEKVLTVELSVAEILSALLFLTVTSLLLAM